jgi:type VI protein secretion system component Hcp
MRKSRTAIMIAALAAAMLILPITSASASAKNSVSQNNSPGQTGNQALTVRKAGKEQQEFLGLSQSTKTASKRSFNSIRINKHFDKATPALFQ